MHDINWVELWVLNQLVCNDQQLWTLVHDPTDEAGRPYWSFPAREALRAGSDTRLQAALACVNYAWIRAYPISWSRNRHFSPWPALDTVQWDAADQRLMAQFELTLTQEGHRKWEALFEPDWTRFWKFWDDSDRDGNQVELSVLYASNEMLDDLVQWLPAFFQLDQAAGLNESKCNTYFQYRAAVWVNLPCAKIMTFLGRDEREKLREIAAADPQAFMQYLETRGRESDRAVQVLYRLSKRWDCVDGPSACSHDAIPQLITPSA